MKETKATDIENRVSRADVHVHSKYSNRPSEWFLRRIGAPESYIEPRALYETCKRKGMDFVTVADHNNINGVLEIADLPGVFLSSEITTYFPEDSCKIHCLVLGITESRFKEIQEIRENIYEFRDYLVEKNIMHSIAHPLFRVNDRLTLEQFEKLLVLFNNFEILNGSRCIRAGNVARAVLEALDKKTIEELADKYDIAPHGETPWRKGMTGGSDDHSGLYTAEAYTETPHASNVFDYLENLREGRMSPGGRGGSSVRLAHSLYKISYSYYSSMFVGSNKGQSTLLNALTAKIAGNGRPEEKPSLGAAMRKRFKRIAYRYKEKHASKIETILVSEISAIFNEEDENLDRSRPGPKAGYDHPDDEQRFAIACRISQQLSFKFFADFVSTMKQGQVVDGLQSLFSIAPIMMGISPYLTAYGSQHKDESFVREVALHFPGANHLTEKTGRRAWISDTFKDVNGVAHTINKMCTLANEQGDPITLIICSQDDVERDYPVKKFRPVGSFPLPEYESVEMTVPPLLEIIAYIEEQGFDELIISTPGPLGLCGLLAAKLLNLRVSGIYHTDLPKFVQNLTDDDSLEEVAWQYMRWFYGKMETIHVPSIYYQRILEDNGLGNIRMVVLPRGVDRDVFNPEKRDDNFWATYGLNGGFKYVYVGRVSGEKNVESMLKAFVELSADESDVSCAVVGGGPALDDLKQRYTASNIVFTGYLHGEDLAKAYASANAFVFPSMTDTFGNAVLEAHACGLPAIVSDKGGPAEIVHSHKSGLVVDAADHALLRDAMLRLKSDRKLYDRLTAGALAKAEVSSWKAALSLLKDDDEDL